MGLALNPIAAPLLPRLSQGRNSGEGTPSSSPDSVFGEEPRGRASRRRADAETPAPPRRHGGGASSAGAHPRGAPPLSRRPRAPPPPRGGGPRTSPTPAHPLSEQKSRAGRKPGARGKGEAARAGRGRQGARTATPAWAESTSAPKLADVRENPASRGRCLPGRPSPRARQRRAKSVALLVTEIWGR